MTVLMVEHDMGMVMDISDHVVVLNFGQVIASGTPAEVRRDPEVIERLPRRGDGGAAQRLRAAGGDATGSSSRSSSPASACSAGGVYALDRARLRADLQGHAGRQLRHRRDHDARRLSLLRRHRHLGLPSWLALALALAGIGLLGAVVERIVLRPLLGRAGRSASSWSTIGLGAILHGVPRASGAVDTCALPQLLPRSPLMIGEILVPGRCCAASRWRSR